MNANTKPTQAPAVPRPGREAASTRFDEFHLRAPKSLEFGELGVHKWHEAGQDPQQKQALAQWQKAWRALRGALSGER